MSQKMPAVVHYDHKDGAVERSWKCAPFPCAAAMCTCGATNSGTSRAFP